MGDPYLEARRAMAETQLRARGIADARVLAAMEALPRERFVAPGFEASAYADAALPLKAGATISQPYIVAFMAEALELRGVERVLEVGSGSGYLCAVLDRLAAEVHGLELDPELAADSARRLAELGCGARIHVGDGAHGLPAFAPFDAILLSCAAPEAPPALLAQLAPRGRLLMPLGAPGGAQWLVRVRKDGGMEKLLPVLFVPMR